MKVERSVTVDAPQDEVWRHVGDPGRHQRFIDDFSKLERRGKGPVGVGSRYSVRVRVGAAHPGGLVEVVEYDPGWELAWSSVTGLEHRLRWRIRPAGQGRSRVTLRLIYRTPGMWGPLTDRVAAAVLGGTVERWLRTLKRQVESELPAGYAGRPGAIDRLLGAAADVRTVMGAGLVRPLSPGELAGIAAALAKWGFGPQAAYAAPEVHSGDRVAIVDELAEVTFADAERQAS